MKRGLHVPGEPHCRAGNAKASVPAEPHAEGLPCTLLAAAFLATQACTFMGSGADAEAALAGIGAEEIRAHVTFLADDLLEGRGSGTRGFQLAANYVAAYFAALGLEPAGDDGTYFQRVLLRRARVEVEESSLVLLRGRRELKLAPDQDYLAGPHFLETVSEFEAPAVFVGYGVTAPELDHDDYAGVDADGKIAVMLWGAPSHFPPNPAAHYSSGEVKGETAVANGAVGIITVATPVLAGLIPWEVLARLRRRGGMRWVDRAGAPHPFWPEIRGAAILSPSGAEAMLDGAPMSLEEIFAAAETGDLQGFDLPGSVRLRVVSEHTNLESPNIVAKLSGSDPDLRDEYLVYTAHVDHEGIGEPRNGNSIYNGAYDNASGTAALLAIAEAFASLSEPPPRSVLFVGTTAEEEGLLGAEYFAENPPVSIDSIVANVNMDGNHMMFPVRDILALGGEHSSLGELIAEAAAEVELEVSADPMPEQNLFIRSDQYPFIKKGVPALFLINGFNSSDPDIDGMAAVQRWMQTVYHTPQDDLSQEMHWESGAAYARVGFLAGYRIATDPDSPRWNAGDFFGEKFGQGR